MMRDRDSIAWNEQDDENGVDHATRSPQATIYQRPILYMGANYGQRRFRPISAGSRSTARPHDVAARAMKALP